MQKESLVAAPFFNPLQINVSALRLCCVLGAIGLYAVFSSPTPDHPGLAEALIGVLLVLAIGLAAAMESLRFRPGTPLWQATGQLFLLYGLSLPLLAGLVRGHAPGLILRDLVPFLFLSLPIFLGSFFARQTSCSRYLLWVVVCAGMIFSLRALMQTYGFILSFLGSGTTTELTYFANAPTVLFAALFLLSVAQRRFLNAGGMKDIFAVLLFSVMVVPPAAAMAIALQRASLGYLVLYTLILLALALYKRPARAFILLALGMATLWPAWGIFSEVLQALMQKTHSAGLNMRVEEMASVWREISVSPWSVLFGSGWGGTFQSPAVAGIRVNYTHSLLTSALLKTGLTGLCLIIFYLSALASLLFRFLQREPMLALALAGPFLIDVFLYASFKSLDFGLILLLIPALATTGRNVASQA